MFFSFLFHFFWDFSPHLRVFLFFFEMCFWMFPVCLRIWTNECFLEGSLSGCWLIFGCCCCCVLYRGVKCCLVYCNMVQYWILSILEGSLELCACVFVQMCVLLIDCKFKILLVCINTYFVGVGMCGLHLLPDEHGTIFFQWGYKLVLNYIVYCSVVKYRAS